MPVLDIRADASASSTSQREFEIDEVKFNETAKQLTLSCRHIIESERVTKDRRSGGRLIKQSSDSPTRRGNILKVQRSKSEEGRV